MVFPFSPAGVVLFRAARPEKYHTFSPPTAPTAVLSKARDALTGVSNFLDVERPEILPASILKGGN